MKKLLVTIFMLCLTVGVHATTGYVNPGESIQDAINSATYGDTIIVNPGIHYGNIHFSGKNIVLTGTNPTDTAVVEATVIDALDNGSVVTFLGSEGEECVLTGLTITGGYAFRGGGIDGGYSYATIKKNISDNWAMQDGGGITDCSGLIQDNLIENNSTDVGPAYSYGGGLSFCGGKIKGNTIRNNSSYFGGTAIF